MTAVCYCLFWSTRPLPQQQSPRRCRECFATMPLLLLFMEYSKGSTAAMEKNRQRPFPAVMHAVVAMNSGHSKTMSSPMSGFACTAATRNLQTDVAFGRKRHIAFAHERRLSA